MGTTTVGVVGCGYVFDIYMRSHWAHQELRIAGVFDTDRARLQRVAQHYKLAMYADYDEMLADPSIDIVVNLTSIGSHYSVTSRALAAGKHVYSEKPFTTDLAQTRELFDLAAAHHRVLTGAPCNLFSDSIGTVWKAVEDGAIGRPVLIYAELDDSPAHLMDLENVSSPTGAAFPIAEELQAGCTIEHVAYHLVWLCAMFGPVTSVTASASWLIPKKTAILLNPEDTPDVSIAALTFASGIVARVTCSWVAPRDHSFKVIGDEGEISVDNIFHDQSPVFLERYSRVSLSMRKSYTLRRHSLLASRLGVGGRRLRLVRRWKSDAVEAERGVGVSTKHRAVSWLRRHEVYAQDKFLGIAEMALALREGRPQPTPADFLLHLNELTLLIHEAGSLGVATRPTTSFKAMSRPLVLNRGDHNFREAYRSPGLERLLARLVSSLHQE